jgi:hypothetical protein
MARARFSGQQAARRSAESFAPPPPGPAAIQLRRGRHERPPPPQPAQEQEGEQAEPQTDRLGAQAPLGVRQAIEAALEYPGAILSSIPAIATALQERDPAAAENFVEHWSDAVKVGDGQTLVSMSNQVLRLMREQLVPPQLRQRMATTLADVLVRLLPASTRVTVNQQFELHTVVIRAGGNPAALPRPRTLPRRPVRPRVRLPASLEGVQEFRDALDLAFERDQGRVWLRAFDQGLANQDADLLLARSNELLAQLEVKGASQEQSARLARALAGLIESRVPAEVRPDQRGFLTLTVEQWSREPRRLQTESRLLQALDLLPEDDVYQLQLALLAPSDERSQQAWEWLLPRLQAARWSQQQLEELQAEVLDWRARGYPPPLGAIVEEAAFRAPR